MAEINFSYRSFFKEKKTKEGARKRKKGREEEKEAEREK